MRLTLFLFFIGSFNLVLNSQINISHLKQDITYLSSNELKGRGTSSAEEKKAAEYIASHFKTIGLVPLINKDYYYRFKYKKSASPHDTIITSSGEYEGINVVGYLDNKAKYTIIVGAHYDHLGLGQDHNSLDPSPEGKIHPGADDNASGTAGVLELARYFSENHIQEKYNFLFMCFSGEELGLLGSKKWCEHSDIPLSNVNYMINMDMIGRLNDSTKNLYVYGNGTSPVWDSLLNTSNTYFHLIKDSSGVGPSDHTSFYLQHIPVLHFFTGAHSDYHKPSDVVEKINFQGESKVLNFIIKLIEASNHLDKFIFLTTKSQNFSSAKFKVTMGVMPDYSYEGKGLRIDAVIPKRPAEIAGIKGGDVVIKMGDLEINNIQDYMKALGQFHKGSKAKVKILRGIENLSFEIEFK